MIDVSTAILIFAAAFYKAVADTLQHHYDTSVFKNLPFQYWNPIESWKYVKFFPLSRFRPDAWHLCNSFMIVSFVFMAVFHEQKIKWFWEVLIYGVEFNLVFGLFYDYILRRKPK